MRFLSLARVLRLHQRVIAQSGGASGVRDLGRLQAALHQPRATFDGDELYPSLAEKAASLGFSLIQGHPFVDGNKRIGHASMAVFLRLNGANLVCEVDEQERIILSVASGEMSRSAFAEWVREHTVRILEPGLQFDEAPVAGLGHELDEGAHLGGE